MKVYIVQHHVKYEGNNYEGVFSTRKKALAYAAIIEKKYNYPDSYASVEMHEIDKRRL